jgi:uncharacterized membrane protein
MNVSADLSDERTWLGIALAAVAALVAGVFAFPRLVYDRFLWQYFWGPVYADAHNARCAVQRDVGIDILGSASACQAAAERGLAVAYPGYTLVSEAGYMITLLFALIGVLLLLRRLEIADDKNLVLALVPFMLFGGALRVVEDANDAVPAGVDAAISYPENVLLISPIIYVTVFVVTLAALLGSKKLESAGYVDEYTHALTAIGTGAFLATFGYLVALSFTTEFVALHVQVLLTVVFLATVISIALYKLADLYSPKINAGTGVVGLVVLWGHAIDGVANVIAADWLPVLGVHLEYGAKHPVNRIIIAVTDQFLPEGLASAMGTSWPFLVVKMAVALLVISLFDERLFDESPRYAVLLMVAVVAVGLGPGTRDMIRTTFGI